MDSFLIGYENIFIIILAVGVRFTLAIKAKSENLSEPFILKTYLNTRKVIRWGGHLFTALTLGLILPEFFLNYVGPKYLPEVNTWHFLGDFIIGFAGYDLIKLGEKLIRPLIEKITGKKFE